MLAGLMENNYERMWSFEKFFDHSNKISSLRFVNVMNLDTCQIIELPFEKTAKYIISAFICFTFIFFQIINFIATFSFEKRLNDFKKKIQQETKIDMNSQLIIYNNLLIDSIVTESQSIEEYPLMDKEHPCILFAIDSSLTCDNLEIIKSSKKHMSF